MHFFHGLALALISGCFFLSGAPYSFSEDAPAPELPPGVIIDKSPDFANLYLGSPSIEILPDGTYIATHDFFGPVENLDLRTHVFESKDKGQTWKLIAKIPNQRASYLFYLNGAQINRRGPHLDYAQRFQNGASRRRHKRYERLLRSCARPYSQRTRLERSGKDGRFRSRFQAKILHDAIQSDVRKRARRLRSARRVQLDVQ